MNFQIICFDFDSTLSRIEGIDELARRQGVFEEVSALTDAAMNGELALEEVYARRLALIKPDRIAIDWLGEMYIQEIVPGVRETIQKLQQHPIHIHIISGGLRQAILPLAEQLLIPELNVHAVDVYFDAAGHYLDFARHSPLAVSGGKAEICRRINPSQAAIAMIGDGKTDLEAKQAGAFMIGFGGVVSRPLVQEQADCFIADTSIAAILPHVL